MIFKNKRISNKDISVWKNDPTPPPNVRKFGKGKNASLKLEDGDRLYMQIYGAKKPAKILFDNNGVITQNIEVSSPTKGVGRNIIFSYLVIENTQGVKSMPNDSNTGVVVEDDE